MAKKKHRLGDLLVEHKVITKKQLKQALEEQSKDTEGRRLGRVLIDLNFFGEETLISFLARQCGIPHLKLGDYEIDSEVIKYVSPELVTQCQAVPIDKLGKILTVAMVDPLDDEAMESLAKSTGFVVKPIVCSEKDIDDAIERYYGTGVLEACKDHRRKMSGVQIGEGEEPGAHIEASLDALSPLKPYVFDDFVVGHANQFTYATAKAVSEAPAQDYNPLFIYSGVGLGKTHLINAIGNHILKRDPNTRVIYLSSERFTAELVNAIQKNDIKSFRKRYREIDVLLLDDIHFLAGKERAQEEFFHTFNELYNAHKQIVTTSDRPPKSMLTLEKRLRSRFEGGIITDIQPPEFETRLAILNMKLEKMGQKVDSSVLDLLAERITANIRELEGALRGVIASAEATGETINKKFATRVLDDILGESEALSRQEEAGRQIEELIDKAKNRLQDVLEAGVEGEDPEGVERLRSQLQVAVQALSSGDLKAAQSAATDAREKAVVLLREQEENRRVKARERLEIGTKAKLDQLIEEIVEAGDAGVEGEFLVEAEESVRKIEAALAGGEDLVPLDSEINKLLKEISKAMEKLDSTRQTAKITSREIEWELAGAQAELDRLAAKTQGRLPTQVVEAEKLLREATELAGKDDLPKALELIKQAKGLTASLGEATAREDEEPEKVDADQAVKTAEAAIQKAQAESAAELSGELLEEAEDLLINAEAMLEAEEYDEALAYAMRATEAAEGALIAAVEQKTEMKREETERNLTKVAERIVDAKKEGAAEYAISKLSAIEEKEAEAKAVSEKGKVEEAFSLSEDLVAEALKLLELTKSEKTKALKRALSEVISGATELVDRSKAHGGAKYCREELSEIEKLLAEGNRLLATGDLEKGLDVTADVPSKARELVNKTDKAKDAEEALRRDAKETLHEAETSLQGALAAGALRYALKSFQEAQVALAKAHEILEGGDPQKAFDESLSVLEQAINVLETIEQKKLEGKKQDLTDILTNAKRNLVEAVSAGAEKHVPSLLEEARTILVSIETTLEEKRYDDGLALKGQLEELVKQTKQETEERSLREEKIRRTCRELLSSAEKRVSEAQALEAERYAGIQLEQTREQIKEVMKLLAGETIEDAEMSAKAVLSMAENLLAATKEERSAEMRRTLEGYVETLEGMLGLIIEIGGKRYTPKKVEEAETKVGQLKEFLEKGEYELGLDAAEPVDGVLSALQEETEKNRKEEEELREKIRTTLEKAGELLGQSLTAGAEEFAGESLKNVQALYSRATEVSKSDNVRRAFELSQGVVARATKLFDETRVRKTEALRARLSKQIAELHRGLAEGKTQEVDRYAQAQFKKAQESVRSVEAALRNEDYSTGLAAAETARVVLEEARAQAKLEKEKETRLKKEVEERLAEAAITALDAENEGAKSYAEEKLRDYRKTVQDIRDLLIRGEVDQAHKISESISAEAAGLLEETISAKRRSLQKRIADGLAAADKLVEEAEELGAARFLSDKLVAVAEVKEQVVALMEGDKLADGVEKVEILVNEAEALKKETARRKKEEEDFKNRVQSSLERAEKMINDAEAAGVRGKELKKAEVLLGQAKRSQEAARLEKSLKFSSLATRKAMDLMVGMGVRVDASMTEDERLPGPDARPEKAKPAEEPEVREEELVSLRPKSKTKPPSKTATHPGAKRIPVDPKVREELEKEFELLPDMNFDTFQVGDVNRFTYQTARAVADSPGTTMYNPLFVHGAVGVGKTHLISATGWRVRKANSDAFVIYMSSERFSNVLVEAIEIDMVEELRSKFTMVDVLIVDDIQFLAGRERAQEEFSHVFTRMVAQDKQVIISSDRPPGELTTLEERLRSWFENGFVTDLQLPEVAVREKILTQQAKKEGLDIPVEVIELFASHINTNLRELQGSLKKMTAHCRLNGVPFTMQAAVEVLHTIMPDVKIDAKAPVDDVAELGEDERAFLEEERKLKEEEELLLAEEAELFQKESDSDK